MSFENEEGRKWDNVIELLLRAAVRKGLEGKAGHRQTFSECPIPSQLVNWGLVRGVGRM